jgi:hypothetical protein
LTTAVITLARLWSTATAWDQLTDEEVMALSRAVLGWADRVFAVLPSPRQGQILDWCQELINLRDEIDRQISGALFS